jgi:hypothetical protein
MNIKQYKEKVRLASYENGAEDYVPTKMKHHLVIVEEIEALEKRVEMLSRTLANTQCSLAMYLKGKPKGLEQYYA